MTRSGHIRPRQRKQEGHKSLRGSGEVQKVRRTLARLWQGSWCSSEGPKIRRGAGGVRGGPKRPLSIREGQEMFVEAKRGSQGSNESSRVFEEVRRGSPGTGEGEERC